MDSDSPFIRRSRIDRSPPQTPAAPSTPSLQPPDAPQPSSRPAVVDGVVASTAELQHWLTCIEQCLNEICSVTESGKLNSEQKLKVSNLCRRVGHGTSQMINLYQSVAESKSYDLEHRKQSSEREN